MEKPRNIYRFDDVCFVLAALMVIPLIWLAWPVLRQLVTLDSGSIVVAVRQLPGRIWLVLAAVAFSLGFLLVIAVVVRRKERAMLAIIGQIIDYRKVGIAALAAESGLSEGRVVVLVQAIERSGVLPVVFDGQYVSLGSELRVPVEPVLSASGGVASGPGPTVNNELLQAPMTDLHDGLAKLIGSPDKAGQLNVPLLVFLFFIFWPLGVIYLASFYLKKQNREFVLDKMGLRNKPGQP